MAQRGEHRVRVEQQALLTVDLYPRTGIAIRVELQAVRPSGATVRIPHTSLEGLALHEEIVLRFTNPRLARPVDLAASAHARVDDGLASTYEMWFVDAAAAQTLLVPHLRSIFNERSAHRVQPDPSRPISVSIEDERRALRVHGRLVDVSVHGLAVRLTSADESSLAATWQARFSMRIPGGQPPIVVDGRIRQRRSVGKEVVLGVEFDAPYTAEQRAQRENLAGWVSEMQLAQAAQPPRTNGAQPPRTNGAQPPRANGAQPPWTPGAQPPRTPGAPPARSPAAAIPRTPSPAPPPGPRRVPPDA